MIVLGLTLALLAFFAPTPAVHAATTTVPSSADDGTANGTLGSHLVSASVAGMPTALEFALTNGTAAMRCAGIGSS